MECLEKKQLIEVILFFFQSIKFFQSIIMIMKFIRFMI